MGSFNQWTRDSLPAGVTNISGLYMTSATTAYANATRNVAGYGYSSVLKYDGVSWKVLYEKQPSNYTFGIYVFSDNDIFVSNTKAFRIQNGIWTDQGINAEVFAFASATRGYASYYSTVLQKYNGFGWTQLAIGSGYSQPSLSSEGNLYAFKNGGIDTLAVFSGDQVSNKLIIPVNTVECLCAYDDHHVWIGGYGITSSLPSLSLYDGTTIRPVNVPGYPTFWRMCFHSATSGWAIGGYGIDVIQRIYMYR